MNAFIVLMLVSAMSFEFLAEEGWIPALFQYTPEVLSLLAAAIIVVVGGSTKFRFVRSTYWLVFGALLIVTLCGLVLNAVDPGPTFTGLRTYVRALPFFLLPSVYPVNQQRLRSQLLLVLVFCVVQLPIAYDQRMHGFKAGSFTGDHTTGTLMNSAYLTIFLICASAVVAAFFIRRKISFSLFCLSLLLVLLPTTLNETKATLILLPIALLSTFVAGAAPGARVRNGAIAMTLLLGFGAIFVPIYDYFVTPRWGYGIMDFLTMEGRVEGYLSKDAGLGDEEAGRVDAIRVPLVELSREPSALTFGFGMGNVSDSALGEQFKGRYFRKFEAFMVTTASALLLETGILGLAFALLIMALILHDSRKVASRSDDVFGALALGWIGVTITLAVAIFYKAILDSTAIVYAYCYFSGVIASHRMRALADASPLPSLRNRVENVATIGGLRR